ncbi:hypothetical protein BR93DRAFT_972020 [Coniochaeta sp. PMI_546]|nr:hypothetical protein BR93DRAFT_972020 [Coniochaeta sp. PMI_546]
MKYITLCSGVLALLSLAVAQGPGWCEGQADPDGGLPEYCYCSADGSCWAVAPGSVCNPTSNERLDPCPIGA